MASSERFRIAERVRGLLSGQDGGNAAATARRLGVEELALRMTIDDVSPHPVIDVLVAVIARYGVDPTWLLTGEYDPATHRKAADADRESVIDALRELSARAGDAIPLSLVRDTPSSVSQSDSA